MNRFAVIILLACGIVVAQGAEHNQGRKGGSKQPVQTSRCNDVPAHSFDLILGRPAASSVTVSVLSYDDVDGWLAYGTATGKLVAQTAKRRFKRGEPAEIVLSSLTPNTEYHYQFRSTRGHSDEFAFHTARPPGRPFTFTITADSHLDERTEPSIYQRTLADALAARPDFHIDLGDTFMSEKHPDREDYYAWQWGDAQFIVLDPFWFTQQQRGRKDNWSRTLGSNQYQWLKGTLEASNAKFIFMFIHHLVGGANEQCRGGAEAAPWYEWGGGNPDGTDGCARNRPG